MRHHPALYLLFIPLGIMGGWLARRRGRNVVFWALLCTVAPLLLYALYSLKPKKYTAYERLL